MKVGIDVSKLHRFSTKRGIGFYVKNIFEALKKYTDLDVVLIEKKIDEKFDLIRFPFFDFFRPTLPIQKKIPTVVTVHDVIPLIFPKQYPPGIKGKIIFQRQKFALKSVKAIITDSLSSKKDISKYLDVNPKLIYPIHLASNLKKTNEQPNQKIIERFNLPKKFALFVGNVNWSKNLVNLTQACLNSKLDIVLVGSGFDSRDNLDHAELISYNEFLNKFSSNEKIHILSFVSEEELVSLYKMAVILLLPSFYEGFGLPILEAQTFGTPVITSNTSSMPEVAGEGAIFVDPNDVSSIEEAIYTILKDGSLRKKLIKKGFENVKNFSRKKTVLETLEVYNQIFRF